MKPLAIAAKIEGPPSILEKNNPPIMITAHFPHIYELHILQQKKWSKKTNPALRSGLKKTLPGKYGATNHHQLVNQDKEPMKDTKII